MLFQPLIAAAIDKYRKITLQTVIILFTLISALFCGAMLILPKAGLLLAVVITAALAFTNILQPFVNAISVELDERGYTINFGLCRSFGSFGYAVVSTLMGFMITRFSEQVIPVSGIICCVLFIGTTIPLCRKPDKAAPAAPAEPADIAASAGPAEPAAQSLAAFLFSNRRFLLFLLSVACLFSSHCFTTGYLYQITCNVGGDSSDMGLAGSIAAMLELPGMMLFALFLKKAGSKTLLRISGIGFFLRFTCLFMANSVTTLFIAQFPQAFSYALFIPASVHYVSKLFSKADMAKAQSLLTTAITIGGLVASIAGGWLIDVCGVHFSLLCVTILGGFGAILLFFSIEDVDKSRT